jgi:phosphatidylglycerol:prolipoprotein diacylglycerol transferase
MNPSDARPVVPRHFWVDHLDPWLVHISGSFGIRWYGLAYVAGILIAALVFMRWARRGYLPIATADVGTLIAYAATGVIFGGRIGYCIFYNLHEVLLDPREIFAVWHGGMASHGGILGLVLAICLFAWRRKLDPWIFLDAAAAIGPLRSRVSCTTIPKPPRPARLLLQNALQVCIPLSGVASTH